MIELYVKAGCPFCQKVLLATKEIGLIEGQDFVTVDAAPGTPGREVVQRLGGKTMVPFLVDGDINMYESNDIIVYLKENL